jgi:hypothetical protein
MRASRETEEYGFTEVEGREYFKEEVVSRFESLEYFQKKGEGREMATRFGKMRSHGF